MEGLIPILVVIGMVISIVSKAAKASQKQQEPASNKPRTYSSAKPRVSSDVRMETGENRAADPARLQPRLGEGESLEYVEGIVHPNQIGKMGLGEEQQHSLVSASQIHEMFADRNRLIEGIIFSEVFASRGGRGARPGRR